MQKIGFLDFHTDVHVTFNVFKVFHIIALNLSLRHFITTSYSYAKIILHLLRILILKYKLKYHSAERGNINNDTNHTMWLQELTSGLKFRI